MELLIANRTHDSWDAGDVVAVRPDRAPWGKRELLVTWVLSGGSPSDFPSSHFSIVVFPDLPVDLNLMEPELMQDPDNPEESIVVQNRAWMFDIEALDGEAKAEVLVGGSRTTLPTSAAANILLKADGSSFVAESGHDDQRPYRGSSTKTVRHQAQ